MTKAGFTLFDTPIGRCGIVWNGRGIAGVQLPEATETATRRRVVARFPGATETSPPASAATIIRNVQALLGGRKVSLAKAALDMEGISPFYRTVYEAARTVPPGTTRSYGEIAALLGSPRSARAVGQALGRNPFPILVPCHRVLAAGGKVGGFTAEGGVATKKRMLELESRPLATALDPALAVQHLRSVDPDLALLIEEVGPCTLKLKRTQSVFAALSEAIVYQQLAGKAAATIHARVCALFPAAPGGMTPEHILGASDESLRGAGLSRAKTAALRDLARKVTDGDVPTMAELRRMSDDEIVERLTAVRGIGRWTVEMLLMMRLGRPDVLPSDDYGVRKGFAIAMRRRTLPSKKELERRGERWKPWRTVASWYMWRACELERAAGRIPKSTSKPARKTAARKR